MGAGLGAGGALHPSVFQREPLTWLLPLQQQEEPGKDQPQPNADAQVAGAWRNLEGGKALAWRTGELSSDLELRTGGYLQQ